MRSPSIRSTVPRWTPSAPITSMPSAILVSSDIIFLLRSREYRNALDAVPVASDRLRYRRGGRLVPQPRKIGMDGSDDLGAVADRGRHPLYRARTHVADREHARPAGLKR